MRRYVFVGKLFALLIGFYAMCAALVVGLAALTVFAVSEGGVRRATIMLGAVTVGAAVVVVRGVFVSTRIRARDIVGIEVTPAQQPALWARVGQLADQVGTRAPRRLYLTPEVNAAVWEDTRLLGMIPGKRQMMIGVPLLMALTPGQLDAVLAHELGHYGNRDTRLGGLVGRTRQSVLSAVRAAGGGGRFEVPGATVFYALFRQYARLVLRVTQAAGRAQEYAADRVAAQIAGTANAVAALSQIPAIDAAFDFYVDRYVAPGLRLGLLPPPPELFGGFTQLLAEPARRAELDVLRRNAGHEEADPFDSHPPMPQRVAALEALPPDGVPPDSSDVRALSILAGPAEVLAQVALRGLARHLQGQQAVSWDALAQARGLQRAEQDAQPLRDLVSAMTGQPARLDVLVQLIAAGRLGEILDRLPRNEAAQRTGATARVAREHAKTELARMLRGWLLSDLARGGRLGWVHSWADSAGEVRGEPGLTQRLDAAVHDLVAVRPDDTRLRALVCVPAVTR